MKVDWITEVVSRDKVIILLVNYAFLLVVVASFMIFLLYLTQDLSPNVNWSASLMLLAAAFVIANMFLASYIVQVLHVRNELPMIYFQS